MRAFPIGLDRRPPTIEWRGRPILRFIWLGGDRTIGGGDGSYYGWRWWVGLGPLLILIGRAPAAEHSEFPAEPRSGRWVRLSRRMRQPQRSPSASRPCAPGRRHDRPRHPPALHPPPGARMIAWQMAALFGIMAFCGGLSVGVSMEAWKWRHNVDVIQRVESAGRLFKVVRADD